MRRQLIAAAALAAALLWFPSVANGAGPRLTLDRADAAAERNAQWLLEDFNQTADWEASDKAEMVVYCAEARAEAAVDPDAAEDCAADEYAYIAEPTVRMTGFTLDPCERDSRRKASCDVTYALDSGEQCDAVLVARTTRRDRLAVREAAFTCDGDPS